MTLRLEALSPLHLSLPACLYCLSVGLCGYICVACALAYVCACACLCIVCMSQHIRKCVTVPACLAVHLVNINVLAGCAPHSLLHLLSSQGPLLSWHLIVDFTTSSTWHVSISMDVPKHPGSLDYFEPVEATHSLVRTSTLLLLKDDPIT